MAGSYVATMESQVEMTKEEERNLTQNRQRKRPESRSLGEKAAEKYI